jgi:VanZ like family
MRSKYFSFNKIKPSFYVPILWLIISTVLLTIPGTAFPKENWLDKIWFDKWVHIGMFAIMVVLWCWATLRLNFNKEKLKKVFVFIALGWLAYGIGMEFVQKYCVANRSFDTGDIIADGLGCLAGFIFSNRRYIPKQNLK